MEKLELKHLAPYLPYGLKVLCDKSDFNTIFEMDTYSNMKGSGIEKRDIYSVMSNNYKPILRKLSDITKEIEVNDERFVPADIIFPKKECKSEYERNILIGVLEFENVIKHSCTYFGIVQKLFEWHFDVFGLIEKGLAIDINTIENK